jgi:hypothetical protein
MPTKDLRELCTELVWILLICFKGFSFLAIIFHFELAFYLSIGGYYKIGFLALMGLDFLFLGVKSSSRLGIYT